MMKSTRRSDRIKQKLPLRAQYHPDQNNQWIEETFTTEFSQSGAGFYLQHPVEIGRLIHLTLRMPRGMRAFDRQAERYGIWALIRYIRVLELQESNILRLEIGTAFTGQSAPGSFQQDVATRYDLNPVLTKNNLWEIRERPRNTGRFARQEEARHSIAEEITIKVINERGEIINSGQAETRNISESGAAISTELIIERGHFLLLTHANQLNPLLSAVRGKRSAEGNSKLIVNLEFMSGKWNFQVS